ncbi:MAG: ComF family protein [Gemmatimonadota bacterium]|nr:ComF family protein [Gemmatimonadota bacterium]
MLEALKEAAGCLLDFFYPPACAACGCSLQDNPGKMVCGPCIDEIIPFGGAGSCPRCGMPGFAAGNGCRFCDRLEPSLEAALAAAWFSGPVPAILHRLKYKGMHSLARPVAAMISESKAVGPVVGTADLLLPVPLHRWREFRRGYNQSEKIAVALAEISGKELVPEALVRVRNTRTQTRLNIQKRKANVDGAFRVTDPSLVEGRSVCLVDDVMTTGATLGACAVTLKQSGALRVTACTFAHA